MESRIVLFGMPSLRDKLTGTLDLSLMVQSAPVLLVTLTSMLSTGILFNKSTRKTPYKDYPIILESGCILSFKGNIELSIAMHLSSRLLEAEGDRSRVVQKTFYNTSMLLVQSFVTGVLAGIVGGLNAILNGERAVFMLGKIAIGAVLTCMVTSILFMSALFLVLSLANLLHIQTENFLLPLLSALNDFTIVRGLLLSASLTERLGESGCMLLGMGLIALFCASAIFASRAEDLVPANALEILGASYMLSVIGGYMLEKYSSVFAQIASAFPVFAGMCGSIAFIHIHRRFKQRTAGNRGACQKTTIMLIAFLIAMCYVLLSHVLGHQHTMPFSIAFVILFCIQVMFILYISEMMGDLTEAYNAEDGHNLLPMISSFTDFTSSIVLVTTAFCLQKLVSSK